MKPTQEKIAELAAAIVAGGKLKPSEAAKQAVQVWQAAGAELAALERRQAKQEAKSEARLGALKPYADKLPEGEGAIPLKTFLLLFVDGSKSKYREKRWRDFLADRARVNAELSFEPKPSRAELEASVKRGLALQESKGFPRDVVPQLAATYAEWWQREGAKQRSAKARKGAKARHGTV